ncbi:protein DEHYDRATION-INDUCED 193 [Dorcoceras hygrometricum]|uniref:Protein DEHYDRATION-INDUCED 193 n=1 Tax=Dorcoceras hygrometricum TaxID=472368 RepID=A0A2Z7ACI8_9LAMI|nr:protein DEHYDRATION-INDUCED 193 [Dorcoceras hygrometricum]
MDANFWAARLSSASTNTYKSALQSRSGMKWDSFDAEMLMGFEEIEADDEKKEEYNCPFCSEYFDIVGLCCHLDDEHPVEARNGVCPVCSVKLGGDMIAHITLQHGNIAKMQRKRKSRRAGSHSTLSLLRRELREGKLQSLFGGLATIVSSGNAAPDPLLSSFIMPMVEDLESIPSHSSIESESSMKGTSNTILDRKVVEAPLSFKDKEEKTKRCDFVQGMLLSMILDDNL